MDNGSCRLLQLTVMIILLASYVRRFEQKRFRKIHKNLLKKQSKLLTFWNAPLIHRAIIVAKCNSKLSPKLLESLRQLITKPLKGHSAIAQVCVATSPVVHKPAEMRMGKGKGKFLGYEAVCKKGTLLFSLNGVSDPRKLCDIKRRVNKKLP